MFDLGEAEGAHFITMEFVPGADLKSFIRRSRQLVVGTAVSLAKQVEGKEADLRSDIYAFSMSRTRLPKTLPRR
jgi:hypothetical protein